MSLAKAIAKDLLELQTPGRLQAQYVWIGGHGELRTKTKTIMADEVALKDLPVWSFDGSSTDQAPGHDSEVLLKPVSLFKDPFRKGNNVIVMCECLAPDMTPLKGNARSPANAIFEKALDLEPWFGIEQEYTLFESDGTTPLGWPKNGFPGPQGPYYCSVGAENAFGRGIVEAHYKACLYAGVNISGCNAEVMPGQWEYQVGPCVGIEMGDHLWISRYLLLRVCELFNVRVSFDPKPIPGDWNGAGCHTNYSTKPMRDENGYDTIVEACERLGTKHLEHIAVYGDGNDRRLTGNHETQHISKFSYGVADRGSSIRIPRLTFVEKKGYLEDRRPASNIDPYVVSSKIFETTCLVDAANPVVEVADE